MIQNIRCVWAHVFLKTFICSIFFFIYLLFVPVIRSWVKPQGSQVELAEFYVVVYYLGEPRPFDGVGEEPRHDSEAEPDHRLVVHERVELVAQFRLGLERVQAGVLFRLSRHLQIGADPPVHRFAQPDAQHLALVLGEGGRQEQYHVGFRTVVEHARLVKSVVEHRQVYQNLRDTKKRNRVRTQSQ